MIEIGGFISAKRESQIFTFMELIAIFSLEYGAEQNRIHKKKNEFGLLLKRLVLCGIGNYTIHNNIMGK